MAAPEVVADHHHLVSPIDAFVGQETAAEHGRDPEHRQKVRGDAQRLRDQRVAAEHHIDRLHPCQAELGEHID